VKNGYDADASRVDVTLTDIADPGSATVTVIDDGSGMDWSTVHDHWMVPGTDIRARERASALRSRKFHRLPIGEKGVGRFAVQKIGGTAELVTRAQGQSEIVAKIDWDALEQADFLADASIEVYERIPEVFTGRRTGTRIHMERLRENWTRGSVRALHRAINAMTDPFQTSTDFAATLGVVPDLGWTTGLLEPSDVLDFALFLADGEINGGSLAYRYRFRPFPSMKRVTPRTEKRAMTLGGVGQDGERLARANIAIGAIRFRYYIFDRDPSVLALGVTDRQGLRDYLDSNGGVRVYRGGVRVYDYGEAGNDWLNLGGRRVNVPSKRISNNLVLGTVHLDIQASTDLIEKTNREGFVENDAYRVFQHDVADSLDQVTQDRNVDKARIRRAYARGQSERVLDTLDDLRTVVRSRGLEKELARPLDALEHNYREMRDRLLTAAGTGLSLATVIHEVEKGVAELNRALERDVDVDRLRALARHLADLIQGFAALARRSGFRKESAASLVRNALFNTQYRLDYHGVKLHDAFGDHPDFAVKCSRRLIIATLMNLIDNSIYWLDIKNPKTKRLYIGPSSELGGKSIVVADNGPGFLDPPEFLTEAFVSRRPDGMGLGLHVAREVMESHGGRVDFPDHGDISLPSGFRGAVVALTFLDLS
jgi:signal transduction histidine kinase